MKSDSSSFIKTILRNAIIFMLIISFSVPLVNFFDIKLKNQNENIGQEIIFYKYNDINKMETLKNSYNLEHSSKEKDCKINYIESENKYSSLLEKYADKIQFYSKTFKVDYNIILNDLIKRSESYQKFDSNNLGFISTNDVLNTYDNVDLGLIAYFEDFLKSNPQYIDNSISIYNGNVEYIQGLIGYFANVYGNVDYNTAVSIGAAETGAFLTSGARKTNNIYGGLVNGRLKSYKNIEYGVLSYIKLLSTKYYSEGLDTIEKIGYVYCPSIENGIKKASSHWLNLVYSYKEKYGDNIYQDLNYVLSLNI